MILDNANIEILAENSPHFTEAISQIGLPPQAEMYDLLDFLEVTKDNYFDEGTQKKVAYLYDWAKGQENPLLAIQSLNSKLGTTTHADRLNKLYGHLRTEAEIKSHLETAQNLMKQNANPSNL